MDLFSKIGLLCFTLLYLVVGCSSSDRAIEISKLETDPTRGKSLYQTLCKGCHGARGTGRSGPNLVTHIQHHDVDEFADYILEGPGSMPSFDHLENQEIADLIAYIETL